MHLRVLLSLLSLAAAAAAAAVPVHAAGLSSLSGLSSPLHHRSLLRRNEEFQPLVTADFPHLLGIGRLRAWMAAPHDAVDPCADFYDFSCRGFGRRYAALANTDILSLMQRSNTMLIEQVLAQPSSDALSVSAAEREIFFTLRDYYRSCTNHDIITKRGFDPIVRIASAIVKACDARGASLPRVFGELHARGVYPVFRSIYSKVESDDPRDLRLQFVPANAFDVSVQTIHDVLADFAKAGLIGSGDGNLMDLARWVWDVEQEAIVFLRDLGKQRSLRDSDDQFMSLDELERQTSMDWHAYLEPLHLDAVKHVFLFANADNWISSFRGLARFAVQDLKYFFLWRLAASHYNKLSLPYHDRWSQEMYAKVVSTPYEDVPDKDLFQTNCILETGVHLNYLAGHVFVKYALNATQRAAATDLVQSLVSAFRDRLQTMDWMDEPTRKAALAKLDNMVRVVGYPDWLTDAQTVAEYHSALEFDPEKYFENAVQAQLFTDLVPSIHQLRRQTVDRASTYLGYPWQLNAFHLTDLVQIQINAGLLQRPLFSSSNPSAMNYGSVGMIIGHEITHGFDSNGYQIDRDGVRREWMTPAVQRVFVEHAQCFLDQYRQYSVTLSTGKRIPSAASRRSPRTWPTTAVSTPPTAHGGRPCHGRRDRTCPRRPDALRLRRPVARAGVFHFVWPDMVCGPRRPAHCVPRQQGYPCTKCRPRQRRRGQPPAVCQSVWVRCNDAPRPSVALTVPPVLI
ncbi:hypothetical protein BC831DRAFT_504232 [Entophlyctis helioformis]|nr:hypothetical protein BC831DRAFT_504232 [Entophlyctis helioformis]